MTTQEATKCIKQRKLINLSCNIFLDVFCRNVTNFQKENNLRLYCKRPFTVKQGANMQHPLYSSPLIPLHQPKPLYTKQQASREHQKFNSKLAFIEVIQ